MDFVRGAPNLANIHVSFYMYNLQFIGTCHLILQFVTKEGNKKRLTFLSLSFYRKAQSGAASGGPEAGQGAAGR